MAYLRFEITGANWKISPVFLKDRFLYTVSYKPTLSVINLIKYTYQHERIFPFLEPNDWIKKSIFVQELYCILSCNFWFRSLCILSSPSGNQRSIWTCFSDLKRIYGIMHKWCLIFFESFWTLAIKFLYKYGLFNSVITHLVLKKGNILSYW